MTKIANAPAADAVGSQVDRAVGRLVPERDAARMLELAATAAGYTWRQDVAQQRGFEHVLGLWIPELTTLWNPLTDSGQALDLAVKLGITMYPAEGEHDGATTTWAHPESEWIVVERTADPSADMRRAIVLAAVAIGKTPNAEFSGGPAGLSHTTGRP